MGIAILDKINAEQTAGFAAKNFQHLPRPFFTFSTLIMVSFSFTERFLLL